MDLRLTAEGITIIIAIVVHLCAGIWLVATVVTQLKSVSDSLFRIDKELEKRDAQIAALWKRVDEIRDLIKT